MKKILLLFFVLLLVCAGAAGMGWTALQGRGHGNVQTESYAFTESDRKLDNPERGFYYMHGFRIYDEETDFRENIAQRFCRDTGTRLTMIEINLQDYRDRAITQEGLANLERLFEALETVDKQLIIRFLYDWDGENEKYEPDSLDIILEHIRQAGPVLREHSDQIFTLQGIFIGNWGEMNGTRYLAQEDMQALASTLWEATEENTFLAVRMPAQWRMITQVADPSQVKRGDGTLASRLGLFNDGMLGSWSDYGTYGDHTASKDGPFTYWNREEELAFQDVLCRMVPIGGEVIVDNSYNDLENAIQDMSRMHVTYINGDFDRNVLDKWAAETVREEGCFYGMDGLSYIERHLGYRLLIRDTAVSYDFKEDELKVKITLQNVGFAPVYHQKEARVYLCHEETGQIDSYLLEQDIRDLPGGTESEKLLTMETVIPLAGEPAGNLKLYFDITDPDSGERILLANEQYPEEYGYLAGAVSIQPVETFWKAVWDAKQYVE